MDGRKGQRSKQPPRGVGPPGGTDLSLTYSAQREVSQPCMHAVLCYALWVSDPIFACFFVCQGFTGLHTYATIDHTGERSRGEQ
ncbi:unnamed protein product [Clonostachys rosea]|uniref:Uncharacterized protein n=1 Tax=Bionectria ochroleuca TaxID=29856 RepID=A0ABY6TNP2_BIOOC|nr:unnamed protein product [Clonostachys rosea]